MTAPTDYFVDPSLGSDTGDGTIGTPWGRASGSVVQYALDNITRDATNGDRINIKAGTDDTVSSALSLATYGTPGISAPLIFQGYTSAQGDGGIGGISGGGSSAVFAGPTVDNIAWMDLHLHNTGSNTVLDMDNNCAVINCEVNNTTSSGISLDTQGYVIGCYVHNFGGTGIVASGSHVVNNRIDEDGASGPTVGILTGTATNCISNIIVCAGAMDGIWYATGCLIMNNSIYASGAATGQGIIETGTPSSVVLMNNLVEGFSGTGGVGIDSGPNGSWFSDGNAVEDCATDYVDVTGRVLYGDSDNESLAASPFTSASTDDFSPVNTGNVKEGSLPAKIGMQ